MLYIALRDSASPRTDEDAAMAHVEIYCGNNLATVQFELGSYMRGEADGLPYSRISRAQEIRHNIQKAMALDPGTDKNWQKATVECAGLLFSIVGIKE